MPGPVYTMHDVARIVEDVNSHYNKGADPKTAFVKYASEHNLPPELLKAAVQKWNTYRALNFYSKAANRGDSFDVLDGEEVKNAYVDQAYNPQAETGPVIEESSMEEIPLRKAAGAVRPFHEPYTYTPPADMDRLYPKYAAKTEAELLFEKWAAADKEHREIHGALITSFEATKIAGEECLKHFERDPQSFPKTEAAYLYHEKDKYASVFSDLAEAAKDRGLILKRATKAERRMVLDNDLMLKLAAYRDHQEAMTCLYRAKVALEESGDLECIEKAAMAAVVEPQQIEGHRGQIDDGVPQHGTARPLAALVPARSANHGPSTLVNDKARLPGVPDLPLPPVLAKDVLSSLVEHAGLGEIGARRLEAFNEANEEARHTSILRDLMFSDPVLSEYAPEEVESVAKSIAKLSPEAAGDKNILRSLLREHLQHDALPISTAKALADVHKTRVDADRPRKA